jgi:hypothetical protein
MMLCKQGVPGRPARRAQDPTGRSPSVQPSWRPHGRELFEKLGNGGGWAEFSNRRRGRIVFAGGGPETGCEMNKNEKAKMEVGKGGGESGVKS